MNSIPRELGLHSSIPTILTVLVCVFCALPDQVQAQSVQRSDTRPNWSAAAEHASVSGDWMAAVSEGLRREEYRYSALDAEVWSAPNRMQELRSRVERAGLEVFPRETDASGAGAVWTLGLRTTSFGRVGALEPIGSLSVSVAGARAVREFEPLDEWFINAERGIEHGWTVTRRPGGRGPLAIGLSVTGDLGLRLDTGGRSAVFVDGTGRARILYQGLVAWDATGRELSARMHSTLGGLEVHVDDAGALYPLTVDPLIGTADWNAESNQAGAQFGFCASTAGDVNGDGFDDVIVGALLYDNGQVDEGRAFVYHGSASGLATVADWTAEPNQAGANFGWSASAAGDVNGDGFGDVIIGAVFYTNGESSEGRAFVYHGSVTGLALTEAWTAESNQMDASMGNSVATAGDVNDDGYDDVVVAAALYDNGEVNEGRAYVYHGSPTGLEAIEAWTGEPNLIFAQYGFSVATAGDVNGDGYDDVIIGARDLSNGELDEGRAYVYHGSATGLGLVEAWTAEANVGESHFGQSVSTAGDVNGDGFADVIVGSPIFDNGQINEGLAFVYHGSVTGLSLVESWTAESNQANATFGCSVSTAGDVNNDGFSDVIIAAPLFDNGESDEGRAYVFYGSSTGLEQEAAWTTESDQANALLGSFVSNAGDVNGDGFDDVIAGASCFDNGQVDEGRAFVFHGFSTPSAVGSIFNGTGINPLCFSSSPAVIGQNWNSSTDNTVRAAPAISLMVVRASSNIGTFLAGGELLVDVSSSLYFSIQSVVTGPVTSYSIPVPLDASFAGITATAQGVVFGGGYNLCNAFSFTVGF